MATRKIALMHEKFGTTPGKQCGDCKNLIEKRMNRKYFKCLAYGNSGGSSTDWAKKYPACGLFNKDYNGRKVVECVRPEKKQEEPIPGQIKFPYMGV